MNITFARIGQHPTIGFACRELMRLLKQMDPKLTVDMRIYPAYDETVQHVIWLGMKNIAEANCEQDHICIDVKNGAGFITASNERAVLIAAYRFMKELGCRYLRPGKEGEVIPKRRLTRRDLNVFVCETASYRHRGVCIEGAVSYNHVADMIDFLPKVGMNGYFMQFHVPSVFFKRFYNTDILLDPNPYRQTMPVTDEDVARMWPGIEEEIALRGLDYHATGHGWTCAPFNINATGWEQMADEDVPAEAIDVMAQIDGKRGLFGGVALNTNLCYSNPLVRDKMNDAIVQYCRAHPNVNFLHFWLADGANNHCECSECQKKLPSDYYVMTLNELDEKLTAAGIDTKIVCLIYVDLLWAPKLEKIQNPDRFVLMFAPITRTYSHALTDADLRAEVELKPYARNRNVMPASVAENVARLRQWQQEQLGGDSFDFDYHLMWDHMLSPGYMETARILHKDMANLDKIGLNGMVSCQGQRVFFPTGLPFYAMAAALWNKDSRFEDVCAEYFGAAFGELGGQVQAYLCELDRLFDPVYLRREKAVDQAYYAGNMDAVKKLVDDFLPVMEENKDRGDGWHQLRLHADVVKMHAETMKVYLGGDHGPEARKAARARMMAYLYQNEHKFMDTFDVHLYSCLFCFTLARFYDDPVEVPQ